MFSGIIEEIGMIRTMSFHRRGASIEIKASTVLEGTKVGDSIAVNGCCLTVTHLDICRGCWTADIVQETMDRTCLGDMTPHDPVNLERALSLGEKIGGHLVQGHVDTTGALIKKTRQSDGSTQVRIQAPHSVMRYIAEKGSVAIDGVSLTVASVQPNSFEFAMIPHTEKATILGDKPIGSRVNLEIDLIARYLAKLLESRK